MNEIDCQVCRDLLPLVEDGVASESSKKAVELHLARCEACRALYHPVPDPVQADRTFVKLAGKLRLAAAFLMMLGVCCGLGLTDGVSLFYNILIMPVIGALGYGVFGKKALYELPVLLFVTNLILNLIRWLEHSKTLELSSLFIWTAIYAVLALTGALIAGLLYYAFKKEETE